MKEEEIGKVFSEKLANLRQTPPEGLWADIQNDAVLRKFNRARRFRRIALRGILPVCIAAFVTVGLFAFLNKNDEKADNQLVNKIEKTEPLPNSSTIQSEIISPAPTVTPSIPTPDNFLIANEEKTLPIAPPLPALSENTAEKDDFIEPLPIEASPIQPAVSFPATPQMATFTPKLPSKPQTLPNNFNIEPPTQSEAPEKYVKTSELTYSKDTLVCRNSKVTLSVENALDVRWSTGDFGNTIEIYPEESLQIYADLTKYDKTDTTIYIHINVYDCDVFVPTAFTPNGDGLNDEFMVHAPMDITGYELVIFDKMSRILFQTKSIYQGWDGTFEGKILPQGAYFYVITYRDALNEKHIKKGQIVLVR